MVLLYPGSDIIAQGSQKVTTKTVAEQNAQ